MIRIFDILFSFFGLLVLSPIILVLLIIGLFDTGSPLFRQERVGMNQKPFQLLKFRSMHVNTQAVATHLVQVSAITKWGSFLRKSKLDELPQLFNVLAGDMSFVGPRPNLFNQIELIEKNPIMLDRFSDIVLLLKGGTLHPHQERAHIAGIKTNLKSDFKANLKLKSFKQLFVHI